MNIVFTARFVEAHRRLDSTTRASADKAIRLLASDPRHPSLHLKKVRSRNGIWEVRIDHGHRMTLAIEKDCFVMRNVGKHDETLGNP